jgi:Reverse transcriptase (RNA-dependent DNA polymerase)
VSHTNKSASNSTWSHESAESSRKRKRKVVTNPVGYEKAITATIQETEGDPKTVQEA